MKFSAIIFSLTFVNQVISTRWPDFQWDPETAKDCIEWYNNVFDESCEYVRDYFTITPEQFHQWNPSIDLDCQPWHEAQSYCIVTQERLDNAPKPSTSSSKVSTTTTTSFTPAPSPTSWIEKGCYVETPENPLLTQNMNPNGDASLTIPKCKNICFRRAYPIAGVQGGNQCWCGSFIPGHWADDESECNMPCPGDTTTICGGKERLNIFLAQDYEMEESSRVTSDRGSTTVSVAGSARSTTASVATSAGSSTSVDVAVPRKTSGVRRNVVMFWQ
jgi:hypothetical protein